MVRERQSRRSNRRVENDCALSDGVNAGIASSPDRDFLNNNRYYVDGPKGRPDWGLRFAVTFLFKNIET